MAAPGKESKEKKAGKEDPTASLLRRISDELSALRADVESIKAESRAEAGSGGQRKQSKSRAESAPAQGIVLGTLKEMLTAEDDAAISIAYAYRITDATGTRRGAADEFVQRGLGALLSVEDSRVARLGYALSSAPKVAIVRILLTSGSQSAANIGEKTGLTTGSLYHHIRELTHASVIESTVRNRLDLTEIGRQTAMLLFVQAARMHIVA